MRILDIAAKDLLQLLRDKNTFLFLLLMPLIFTLMFGFASGGFSKEVGDPRLPIGFLDEDRTWLSRELRGLLEASEVFRLETGLFINRESLEAQVTEEKIAAAVIIPKGYSQAMLGGKQSRLFLIADTSTTTGTTIQSDVISKVIRLENAVRTAVVLEEVAGDQAPFDYSFDQALARWDKPPIQVTETTSTAIKAQNKAAESLAHNSPAFMLQFAIAGLLTCAQVIVSERKSRALQRLLTTAARRSHILLGHFLAIFFLIAVQFLLLILFGQLALKVNYLANPSAILLVALTSAFCIACLGLLIGMLARTEEQAVIFSLVPMFLLAGLGGAWVPLDVTGPAFQVIGHFSPIAWAMDGFKNITIRGLGFESVLLPVAALAGYGLLFMLLAFWRFRTE